MKPDLPNDSGMYLIQDHFDDSYHLLKMPEMAVMKPAYRKSGWVNIVSGRDNFKRSDDFSHILLSEVEDIKSIIPWYRKDLLECI